MKILKVKIYLTLLFTRPANYYLIEKAFEYLKDEKVNDGLVDFGCGKGRVLVVAAYYGFKSITGIDFSRTLCLKQKQILKRSTSLFPEY